MANNRFEHFQEQFETAITDNLTDFKLLPIFDENKWESYQFPYVFCFMGGEVQTAETDEGGIPVQPFFVQREFVLSVGYHAQKNANNLRVLETECWRVQNLVERTIRGLFMADFDDAEERAIPKVSYPTASARDIERTSDTKGILLIRGVIVYELYTY